MDLLSLVENMSEEMYLRLKCAAETGKWPDGVSVDKEQQTSALQLSMAYQSKHLNSDEILTIGTDGHIVSKTKRELKEKFSQSNNIARFSDI